MPAVEATLRTAPRRRSDIDGMNAELSATTASTKTRTCSISRSGSALANGPFVANPALLTRISTRRPRSSIRAGRRPRGAGCSDRRPPLGADPVVGSERARELLETLLAPRDEHQVLPRAASSDAIAAPIPALAP